MDTGAPLSPVTLPASWYADPNLWSRERRAIFAKSWHFVTHASALPETGAWRAETLAGYPVLVVRDEAGALRGFHNVCRHRAGPLTEGEEGRCEGALVCRYHGWRYQLDGRLRLARDFGAAADFDPREFSLWPVRVETWRGLVFANLDLEAAPLTALLAPLDARLGDADWSKLHIAARRSHDLGCNWKTYVENYLEGYHVPLLHPSLDAEVDSSRYAVRMEGAIAIHEVPMRDPNPVYEGLWAWAWPNVAFNIYARGLMLERMSPIDHARTRLNYLYLMPEGETVSDETMKMSDAVVAEDKWVVERVQQNLGAGIYEVGRLSPKHEGCLAAFQRMVRAALA
ncbi:MAG: aromatic ring-hydroxylating dioxygenase subunit alpha [Hyphomonadaceae bacterium]|nr:aromatic ring-hydroxylating dioxygenase subunit alpha [Hyphomonadaceae bacterium]